MLTRKHLKTTLILLLFSALSGMAATPTPPQNPFTCDERPDIDAAMQDLSRLETLVETQELTLESLKRSQSPAIHCLQDGGDLSASVLNGIAPENERFLDLPGFFWGFCCCLVGVFFVYLDIDDPKSRSAQGRQAWLGCLIGGVLWATLYVLVALSAQ